MLFPEIVYFEEPIVAKCRHIEVVFYHNDVTNRVSFALKLLGWCSKP